MEPTLKIRCMKCRKNYEVPISQTVEVAFPNGSTQRKAICAVCGTKMTRFMKGPKKGYKKSEIY